MPLKHPRPFGVTYKRSLMLPNNKRSRERGEVFSRLIEIYSERERKKIYSRRVEKERGGRLQNCL